MDDFPNPKEFYDARGRLLEVTNGRGVIKTIDLIDAVSRSGYTYAESAYWNLIATGELTKKFDGSYNTETGPIPTRGPDFSAPEGSPENGWVKMSTVLFKDMVEQMAESNHQNYSIEWGFSDVWGFFSPTVFFSEKEQNLLDSALQL